MSQREFAIGVRSIVESTNIQELVHLTHGVALGVRIRATPNRTEPNRTEPNRTEPHRTGPGIEDMELSCLGVQGGQHIRPVFTTPDRYARATNGPLGNHLTAFLSPGTSCMPLPAWLLMSRNSPAVHVMVPMSCWRCGGARRPPSCVAWCAPGAASAACLPVLVP